MHSTRLSKKQLILIQLLVPVIFLLLPFHVTNANSELRFGVANNTSTSLGINYLEEGGAGRKMFRQDQVEIRHTNPCWWQCITTTDPKNKQIIQQNLVDNFLSKNKENSTDELSNGFLVLGFALFILPLLLILALVVWKRLKKNRMKHRQSTGKDW